MVADLGTRRLGAPDDVGCERSPGAQPPGVTGTVTPGGDR